MYYWREVHLPLDLPTNSNVNLRNIYIRISLYRHENGVWDEFPALVLRTALICLDLSLIYNMCSCFLWNKM